jgi:hypothetical protein
MKALVSALAACGLLSGGLVLAAASHASPAAALARKAPDKAKPQPVITGTIRFKNHKPVASATVKLYVDPLPKVLRKVKEGHTVPDALVGKTTTSRKGTYSVSLTAKSLALIRARAVHGIADLHILAFTHKDGTVLWIPRTVLVKSLKAGNGVLIPSLDTPEVVNLTMPSGEDDAMSPFVRNLLIKSGVKNPHSPSEFDWAECGTRYPVQDLGPRMVTVGGTYSNMSDVSALFSYTAGQSTSFGLGFNPSFLGSFNPGPGSLGLAFSINGSIAWNSSITEPYPEESGQVSYIYRTQFVFWLYFTICAGWTVQPVSFWGGAYHDETVSPSSNNTYCTYQNAASAPVQITSGQGTDYSQGISISGLLGINLNSDTATDQDSELDYWFPKGGHLCGTTGTAGNPDAPDNTIYAGYWNGSKDHGKGHTR